MKKHELGFVEQRQLISDLYYASIVEQLRFAILEKHGAKVVLLLDDNAPVHKCHIVQAAIRKTN